MMKKSAIAIAVAGVMAAPLALADVQLSGQLQTQLVHYSKNTGASGGKGLYVTDGGMYGNEDGGNWGAISLTATEDLGDGLKALAKYAFNLKTDSGIGTREAYVGLAGDWGAVLGGRINHPYKTSTFGWDPFAATFMQGRGNAGMGGAAAGFLYGPELSNGLAYAGNFSGVKIVAAAFIDEAPKAGSDKTNAKHAYAFSVNAPIGPVEVALAHIDASQYEDGLRLSANKKQTATKLGAKWSAGDLTLAGQVESLDKGMTGSGKRGVATYLTGGYAMGNNTVSLSLGHNNKKVYGGSKAVKYAALGFDHAFSKNTDTFVGYRMTDGGSGAKENAVGAGLRVRF